MSHADKVRDAEKRVLDAAIEWRKRWGEAGVAAFAVPPDLQAFQMAADAEERAEGNLVAAVDLLESLHAATCPKCGGNGKHPRKGRMWTDGDLLRFDGPPCPANCDDGRAK